MGNDGQLSTHTEAEVGRIDDVFFAHNVRADFVGANTVIAHLRIGIIQIAIGRQIQVIAKRGRIETATILPVQMISCTCMS